MGPFFCYKTHLGFQNKLRKLLYVSLKIPPVGVEPTVSRLEGGCLIHLATEAVLPLHEVYLVYWI